MTYVSDDVFTFETPNHLLREVALKMKVDLADNDHDFPASFRVDGMKMDPARRKELFQNDMHPRGAGYKLIVKSVFKTLDMAGVLDLLPEKTRDQVR